MEIKPIGIIKNYYDDKFAVPRQSGIADKIISQIILKKEYGDDCVRGLDGFSHIWLIWEFDRNDHTSYSQMVRPPRLGGNKRVGVFASRSPYRPNPLGLSSVKIENITRENGRTVIEVSGADIVDGTPIYDIKPYIKFTDSHEDSVCGYVDKVEFNLLSVEIPPALLDKIEEDKRYNLIDILTNDPRPAYKQDDTKEYGFAYGGMEIKFRVNGNKLTVTDIV